MNMADGADVTSQIEEKVKEFFRDQLYGLWLEQPGAKLLADIRTTQLLGWLELHGYSIQPTADAD